MKRLPYALRAIFGVICFPLLPALPVLTLGPAFSWELPSWLGILVIIWLPVSLVLWALLFRFLTVRSNYICAQCGSGEAKIVPVERDGDVTEMFVACELCGHRRTTKTEWNVWD